MKTLRELYDKFNVLLLRMFTACRSEKGQTLVEYALILVLVALAVIVALQFLATKVGNTYNNAGNRMPY